MQTLIKGFGRHGVVRGLDHVALSPQFEGRFGRIFRVLQPANHLEEDLMALGNDFHLWRPNLETIPQVFEQ